MDTIKNFIPIDLFSKRRLIKNLVIYGIYSFIFSVCFIISAFASNLTIPAFHIFSNFINILIIIIAVKFLVFNFFNFKRISFKLFSTYDIVKLSVLVFLSSLTLIIIRSFISSLSEIPLKLFIVDGLFTFVALFLVQTISHFIYTKQDFFHDRRNKCRTLIIGAGETGEILLNLLSNSRKNKELFVVGFVDDDLVKIGKHIQGRKIYGPIGNLSAIVKKYNAEKVIIAMPSAPSKKIHNIIDKLNGTKVTVATMPSYFEIINGNVKIDSIRNIEIKDLLGRSPVQLDTALISSQIHNKNILVTGAAGSVGSEICRQLLQFNPKSIIALDQSETNLFFLDRELNSDGNKIKVIPVIADILNEKRIFSIFEKYHPEIVFHAAAYKHVPMMELNIEESIINNILGTKIVADIASIMGTVLFSLISTDKAVNPTSVMGLTKRMAEIYVQTLNQISDTHFITIRFGNVLGSSGSVVPIFKEQIANGGPVTVTHPEMERYFMMLSEAAQLVLQAGAICKDGEIFLLDMGKPIKILDLAKTMIKISGYKVNKDIEILFTGLRPGEKLFEELKYDEEHVTRTHHSKIFVCKHREYKYDYVNNLINELVNNYSNREKTLKIINELVPEYKKDYENINFYTALSGKNFNTYKLG